jgi:DNA-binding ferritin-like protein
MSSVVYTTGNDLPETVRSQVIDLLNQRLADAIDLDTQAKQAQWLWFVEAHVQVPAGPGARR